MTDRLTRLRALCRLGSLCTVCAQRFSTSAEDAGDLTGDVGAAEGGAAALGARILIDTDERNTPHRRPRAVVIGQIACTSKFVAMLSR